MKNYKIISILFTSLFLLSACSTSSEVSIDTNLNTEEVAEVVVPTCDMVQNPDYKERCISEQNDIVISALNKEIRDTFDLKRCDELSGEMITSCKSYIKESGVTGPISKSEIESLNKAMRRVYNEVKEGEEEDEIGHYNLAYCSTLTAPGLKEYCQKILNQKIDNDKFMEIVESGKVSRCNELSNKDRQADCRDEM